VIKARRHLLEIKKGWRTRKYSEHRAMVREAEWALLKALRQAPK